MRKAFFATICLLALIWSFTAWAEVSDEDFGTLVRIADNNKSKIHDTVQVLKGMDQTISAMYDPANGGARDITSRLNNQSDRCNLFRVGIKLRPDYFNEESFARDIAKSPEVSAYVKGRGEKFAKWELSQRYAEVSRIYPRWIQVIGQGGWLQTAWDAIATAKSVIDLEEFKSLVHKVSLLYDLAWDKEGRRKLATRKDLAELERAFAKALDEAKKELAAQKPQVVEIDTSNFATKADLGDFVTRAEISGFATKTDVDEVRAMILDADGNLVFATKECLREAYDSLSADIGVVETAAYRLSDKKREEMRVGMYSDLLRKYDGDHEEVKNHLRRRAWSEKHIREAASKVDP